MTASVPTSVLLVGAHGYGVSHLRTLERLGSRVRLIGVVDPRGGPPRAITPEGSSSALVTPDGKAVLAPVNGLPALYPIDSGRPRRALVDAPVPSSGRPHVVRPQPWTQFLFPFSGLRLTVFD